MSKKTVKFSIKPANLIIVLAVLVAVIAVIFLVKLNSKKTFTNSFDSSKEIVLPTETGVLDFGFEGNPVSLSVLNAKTIFDQIEEIEGKKSLKIYFPENFNSSVKINDYINSVEEDGFYRLSLLAKSGSESEKEINVSIAGEEASQDLGKFTLGTDNGVQYFEFNFQAENSAKDLIFTSGNKKKADVWIDDILVEKLNVDSLDQMGGISPTIFGGTSRFNIDQSREVEADDSGNFFVKPNVKIGQIFHPTQPFISGIALKIQKAGNGGTGNYLLQIREYDERLGIISEDVIASRIIYTDYPSSILEEVKNKEQQMREEFDQNEKDIREEIIPNDPTVDQYPQNFTQQQIDESKAKKRKSKFELEVSKMKESFNKPYEISVPIAAKLDTNKKYWIGINNAKVKNDKRNYIKVFFSRDHAEENNPGFASFEPNTWQEYYPLWFKTFYPIKKQVQDEDILSGATISDFGNNKIIYRYQFGEFDYSALSGFPGRKIYDMYDGNYEKSDETGNYTLSADQYATYKFNTVYPAKKIILKNANYNQSLAIDFSANGENWDEIFSENPAENKQTISPIVINPEEKSTGFYLRIRPDGNDSTLTSLSLEAELER